MAEASTTTGNVFGCSDTAFFGGSPRVSSSPASEMARPLSVIVFRFSTVLISDSNDKTQKNISKALDQMVKQNSKLRADQKKQQEKAAKQQKS